MNVKHLSLILLVVTIWGVNFSVIKVGLEDMPPIFFSALRFAIIAFPTILFIPFPTGLGWYVFGVGLFLMTLTHGFLFFAMQEGVGAGLASLILQTQVFFTILLGLYFLNENLQLNQKIGLVFSLFGFLLFAFNTGVNVTMAGLCLLTLAAFSWSIANLLMKKMGAVNLAHFIMWTSLVPPIPMLLISYFYESQNPLSILINLSFKSWIAIFFVAYISTVIAFAIWGKLLRGFPAATITPFALLIPVVGVITAALFLGERLTTMESVGSTMIMTGLITTIFGSKWIKRPLIRHSSFPNSLE